MTAASSLFFSVLVEIKKSILLMRRKPALTVLILTIMLLFPTATAQPSWIKTYQGEPMDVLTPTSIVQTNDAGFAVTVSGMLRRVDNVGYNGHFTTTYELQLIKVDPNGQIQWKRNYEQLIDPNHATPTIPAASDRHTIVQTTDQGYAIASSLGYMGWLVKTDPQGTILWTKTYTDDEDTQAISNLYSMTQSKDGGFVLAGSTWTSEGGKDFWLIKTDSRGNVQWQQRYNSGNYLDNSGNQYPQEEEAKSVIQTQDGGFALSGSVLLYKASTGNFVSATWVVKTDSQGKQTWTKGYDLLNEQGFTQTIIQTKDNGYAIAGTENNNFCLFKISSSGQMQWSKTYDDEQTNSFCSLVRLNDGGFALAGTGYTEVNTISLLRADSSGQTTWIKTFNAKQDSTSNDLAAAMILSNDGSYVLTGSTTTQSETHQDVLVVKTEKPEESPEATPTAMPATTEPQNPNATPSPSVFPNEPSDTNDPTNPDNTKTSNPNMENAFNSSTTWIGLAAGIAVVVTVSLAIIVIKKSKKPKHQ